MEIKARTELPILLKYFNLPLIAAEIGVAGGANATDLLKNGIEKIFLIDNWATTGETGDGSFPQDFHDWNYQEMLKNLKLFQGKYHILKGLSSDMHSFIFDGTLGLVYVDGAHDYESVKSDSKNYIPKLVKGGIIAFHDYPNEAGVKMAVDEFAALNNYTIHEIPESCIYDAGAWIQI
jgi:hypothetical protein